MLHKFESFDQIDPRRLMDIYQESNTENLDYFYPDAPDKMAMLPQLEQNFLRFVETGFFSKPGNSYFVLEESGVWRSALRLYRIEEGLYYIEALETRPDSRRRGCAVRLLNGVIAELQKGDPFRLCDCVNKKNLPSLRTHQKCGFSIASDSGMDYRRGESRDRSYGMEYRWDK